MKLFKVPNNTMVKIIKAEDAPPGAWKLSDGEEVFFHHIDGMYSLCKRHNGEIVHLKAWTEVEIVE